MSSGVSPAVDVAASDKVLKPNFGASRKHFIFTEEHDALRESIGNFAEKELAPHADRWEEETFDD
ncbi:MAG: acyl-CoA dehydrogenase family protein, partial [Thermoleophilaceae bacterium]